LNHKLVNWVIFIALSVIWGSSFILMKEGLTNLSAFQVASVRIISSGLVLLPIALRHIKQLQRDRLFYIFMSGVLGSLLPAYLFCLAEEGIDSSMAGALNALTPFFVIITGTLFFKAHTSLRQVLGIVIAFLGSALLFVSKPEFFQSNQLASVSYILIATFCYGLNVQMVNRHLHHIPSLQIASWALVLNAIPAGIVLFYTGYFSANMSDRGFWISSGFAAVLGIFGTAVASIIFYMLIKRAGAVFASMVTYGIPFVAIFWGVLDGENVGWWQVTGLCIILTGVYIANRKASPSRS
jgi:hypothetical protein